MTTQFQRSAADWCSAARMRVRGPENGWLPHLQSALVTTMAGFDDPGQAMTWFLPSSAALTDPVIASFQHIGLTADGFAHDLLVESACRGLARAAIAGEAVIDARWAKVGRRSTDGATTPPYPTLRLADARYTAGHHHHFGYFGTTGLSWKTKLEIRTDATARRRGTAGRAWYHGRSPHRRPVGPTVYPRSRPRGGIPADRLAG